MRLGFLRWGSGIRIQKGERKKGKKGFLFIFWHFARGKTLLSFGLGISGGFLGFGGRKVMF